MEESNEAYSYLNHKYGKLVKPYKLSYNFFPDQLTVTKGSDLSKSIAVNYNYLKRGSDGNSLEIERLASKRAFVIQDPNFYGSKFNKYEKTKPGEPQKVFIVNGYCEQDDGNFCRPFHVTKLGDSGIFIGSFPNDENDILKLKNEGVSAVLNLQTPENLSSFSIDWKNSLKLFYVNGIVVAKNVPVDDSSEETYCQDIF